MKINNQLICEICDSLNMDHNAIVNKSKRLTLGNVIKCILKTDSCEEAATMLGIGKNTLFRLLAKNIPSNEFDGLPITSWKSKFLFKVNKKVCFKCKRILPIVEFSTSKNNTLCNKMSICKECDGEKSKLYRSKNTVACRERSKSHYYENKEYYKEKNLKRKQLKKDRTPKWADKKAIREFYKNRPDGYHVDHIVPLMGKNVSGLHVENNLQYITATQNLEKSNKY